MKLLPLSAGLLAYASYATETAASYLPATFVARHRKASPGVFWKAPSPHDRRRVC